MKNQTAAFTGHRTLTTDTAQLRNALHQTIQNLYNNNYLIFVSGMAVGFDMLAAEVVLEFRQSKPNVQLIAAIPFVGQERYFSQPDKELYDSIVSAADKRIVVCEHYSPDAYFERNEFLVDNASTLIAYCNGMPSGTLHTVKRAQASGIPIINLF